jgi:hypothetical protein
VRNACSRPARRQSVANGALSGSNAAVATTCAAPGWSEQVAASATRLHARAAAAHAQLAGCLARCAGGYEDANRMPRPYAPRPPLGPAQQLRHLIGRRGEPGPARAATRPHPARRRYAIPCADPPRSSRPALHRSHRLPRHRQQQRTVAGMSDFRSTAFAPLEPHHGEDTTSWHLVLKPYQPDGRRITSQLAAPRGRYGQAVQPPQVSIRRILCAACLRGLG